MKSNIIKYSFIIVLLAACSFIAHADETTPDNTVRKERNFIRRGNELYEQERYADAEVEYRKAIQANQSSEIGMYNLATTLLHIAGTNKNVTDENNPINEAARLFGDVAGMTRDPKLKASSYYNLGNLAFNNEQYDQAVSFYKRSLRANPNDEQCRQNLRLAQLRLNNQNQSQDDKKEDKKEEKKEQQQDQQQNQPQQQPQQNQQQNQQQQQQQQGGMSADNAEQILKAMQNSEQNTQKKVNASRSQEQEQERHRTRNRW